MIHVVLPSQLDDYTGGVREFDLDMPNAESCTLDDVLRLLDVRYPGMRFRVVDEHGRIRRHIAMFVGESMVHSLTVPLRHGARVQIIGALSGG